MSLSIACDLEEQNKVTDDLLRDHVEMHEPIIYLRYLERYMIQT